MLIEITFQKDPSLVIGRIGSSKINIVGHYLDNEYEIYRVVIDQKDQQTASMILSNLRQTYEVAPVFVYEYLPTVPGQLASFWNQGRDILRTYDLENNRTAVIYSNL